MVNTTPDESTVGQFLNELAAGTAEPGGGAATALAAATGAALVAMACRLTGDSGRFPDRQAEMRAAAGVADRLRAQASALAADDVAAYAEVMTARSLPRATEEERSTRGTRLQAALEAATETPLQTADAAAQIIELAARMADLVNPNALSDLRVGALLARAAVQGSALNVRTNVALLQDETLRRDTVRRLDTILARTRPLIDRLLAGIET